MTRFTFNNNNQTFTTGQPSAQLSAVDAATSTSNLSAFNELGERNASFASSHRTRAGSGATRTFGASSSSTPCFSQLAYETHAASRRSMGVRVESYGEFVTERSRPREARMRGVRPTVLLPDGDDDIWMSRSSDWEQYRESDGMSDDEDQTVDAMDLSGDGPTLDDQADQEPLGGEPMDTRVNGEMEEDDPVEELTERLENLRVEGCFMETFFGNTVVDEKGRMVRRSPRLGCLKGSFEALSGDGRFLVRRSRRIANMSAAIVA
jgi:hypothetical protein